MIAKDVALSCKAQQINVKDIGNLQTAVQKILSYYDMPCIISHNGYMDIKLFYEIELFCNTTIVAYVISLITQNND